MNCRVLNEKCSSAWYNKDADLPIGHFSLIVDFNFSRWQQLTYELIIQSSATRFRHYQFSRAEHLRTNFLHFLLLSTNLLMVCFLETLKHNMTKITIVHLLPQYETDWYLTEMSFDICQKKSIGKNCLTGRKSHGIIDKLNNKFEIFQNDNFFENHQKFLLCKNFSKVAISF